MFIVVGWMIAFTFANIFECDPVNTLWDKKPWEGKFDCVKLEDLYISQAYIDVATDFLIICLPIPMSKLSIFRSSPLVTETCSRKIKYGLEKEDWDLLHLSSWWAVSDT